LSHGAIELEGDRGHDGISARHSLIADVGLDDFLRKRFHAAVPKIRVTSKRRLFKKIGKGPEGRWMRSITKLGFYLDLL
jgi:hypothetical protein